MASVQELVNKSMKEAIIELQESNRSTFNLKPEQEEAVSALLQGIDVLAILPTGFGKSLIFQLFVMTKQKMDAAVCTCAENLKVPAVLVICPLAGLIKDQVKEGRSLGLDCIALGMN